MARKFQTAIDLATNRVTNIATPIVGTDASTAEYAKNFAAGEMFVNGFGMQGTYNWPIASNCVAVTDKVYAGKVAFKITGLQQNIIHTENIAVDPSKTYQYSGAVMGDPDAGQSFYLYAVCKDIDGLTIAPYMGNSAYRIPASQTTLAAPLKPGDMTITVANAAGWNASLANRGVLVYPYTNSQGYTYPNYTYSRHYHLGNHTISGNVITLPTAWSIANPNDAVNGWPVGTPIEQTASGGSYLYPVYRTLPGNGAWLAASGLFGKGTSLEFWYGTAFIGTGTLMNYPPSNASSSSIISALSIKQVRLESDSTANTSYGVAAMPLPNILGANDNTAIGYAALPAVTTGDVNTAVGAYAGYRVTTGLSNTFLGRAAGYNIATTSDNTLLGHQAGYYGTGSGNTVIGSNAMLNGYGNSNAVVGAYAGYSLSTGYSNAFFGYTAGYSPAGLTANATTTAPQQTLIGVETGQSSATAAQALTALGYRAIGTTYGTALGANAKALGASSTAIGYGATASNANEIVLGTSSEKLIIPGTQTHTMAGSLQMTTGGIALQLQPGSADHVYMGFYARTAAPTTRTGWVGFGTAAGTTLSMSNEITDGNISLATMGAGRVLVSADPTAALGVATKQYVDNKAPGGTAGGDLTGTYPSPTLAVDRVRKTGDTMTGDLNITANSADVSTTGTGASASAGFHAETYDQSQTAYLAVDKVAGSAQMSLYSSAASEVFADANTAVTNLSMRAPASSPVTMYFQDGAGANWAIRRAATTKALEILRNGTEVVFSADNTTGLITVKGDPTANLGIATKQMVDLKAPLASPALTGTPTVPTATADTNTTQIATTAFVVGQAAATASPMNGTAAVGTSLKYARQDHVHASDTSRVATTRQVIAGAGMTGGGALSADVTLNVVNADGTLTIAADDVKVASAPKLTTGQTISLTGDVTGTSAAWDGSAALSFVTDLAAGSVVDADVSATAAIATSKISGLDTALAAKAPLASPALTGVPTSPTAAAGTNTTQVATTAYVIGMAAISAPPALGTAAVGTSARYARQDHVHAMPTAAQLGIQSGTISIPAVAAGGTTSMNITFSPAFSSVPELVLTAGSTRLLGGVSTVSTTGASISFSNWSPAATPGTVTGWWMAKV